MRLWHIDLIPYLPKSQLLAQWRELNSIFKKQDNHILINYIYDYDREVLCAYTEAVIDEMCKRNIKVRDLSNYNYYFQGVDIIRLVRSNYYNLRFLEHDDEYLTICYWNLREKYLRGQKDFTDDVWERLDKFYKSREKGE